MDEFFRKASLIVGGVGGTISYFLGGWDLALQFLTMLVVIDFATGVAKGFFNHALDSALITLGVYKKTLMFIVVVIAQEIDVLTGGQTPVREIVIFFYIANEGLSILENISNYITIPKAITKYFTNIKEKEDEEK